MKPKLISGILTAGLLCLVLATPLRAAQISEDAFTAAMIQMDHAKPENGERVQSLINCLKRWNARDQAIDNDVEIRRTGSSSFTLTAKLHSPAIFHFQVEPGEIAVLLRVEYQLANGTYSEVTDSDGKRVALRAVCS